MRQTVSPADIFQNTPGTEGYHEHRFPISREMAWKLSQLTEDERTARIAELKAELAKLEAQQ